MTMPSLPHEQMQILDKATGWLIIKEFRNRIVHEHEIEDLADILSDIQSCGAKLLVVIDGFNHYVQDSFGEES